ncbi:hypothetical protein Halxa_0038 (plasmid) [Halopiger xanaduensis SH-6]|uniref:Uncharacterized protein n=1 Tax=Halopiger xanaduensis (strain DSM 18323 / JCM 14033 / SH-6) TaxID=797210 RepID=F8DEK4_HALXS|nr:hypothetical protein Halxa_0038 [Halopiger xanaduensis SH-6]
MTGDERGPNPHDAPDFDRAVESDVSVPETKYGNRGDRPERHAADDGTPPIDDLHETLLEIRHTLQQLEAQLPEPLSLTVATNELDVTADAYARVGSDSRDRS